MSCFLLPNRNSRVHAFIGKRYDGSHWDCRCRSSVFFSTSLGYNELRRRVQRKAVGQRLECSGCNLVDLNIDDDDARRHCVGSCIPACSSYHALSARTVVLHSSDNGVLSKDCIHYLSFMFVVHHIVSAT